MEDDETQRVYVNAGGVVFETLRETLLSTGSKYFKKRLLNYDRHAYLFIDREPALFSIILQHLRTKQYNYGDMSKSQIELLFQEALYFDLPDLQNHLSRNFSERKKTYENELLNELKMLRLALQAKKNSSNKPAADG